MTSSPYLDVARQGRSAWWIYALGFCFILFTWLVLGSILTAIAIIVFGGFEAMKDMTSLPAEQMFLVTNLSFIPFLVATLLVVWLGHGRSPKSLITPFAHIDWARTSLAFLIWTLLSVAVSLAEYLLWPEMFHLSFEPGRFLRFLAMPLLLTPLQIAAEELFFRGYLLQGLGLLTRSKFILISLSGFLFLLPHLANPELYLGDNFFYNFSLTALFYFLFGALAAWATLKDNTLEIALGAHAANNLYVGIWVNFEGSALETPAVVMTSHYDALFNLLAFLVGVLIFAVLMFGVFKKKPADTPL